MLLLLCQTICYTSQQMLLILKDQDLITLSQFHVGLADRNHQIWQRDSLSIPIYHDAVMQQKIEYIHMNPVAQKWSLPEYAEDYYSSARFYADGVDDFGFLTNCFDC
jgi:putative transposase